MTLSHGAPHPLAPTKGGPHPYTDVLVAFPGLTLRLLEVWQLIVDAKDNKEIAEVLNITPNTVKSYTRRLYAITGVSKRTEATKLWNRVMPAERD